MAEEELLTDADLAALCKVSITTVRRWRYAGTGPPPIWPGGRPRYRRHDVEAWLEQRRNPADQPYKFRPRARD